ncbi:hypothetical protein EJB05_27364 [Eragrostis curvula]|uniref:Uncharacterized protein n=1 Tax=Eragrostis curvula TaxID=38414 RepID=A0A5J9UM75_9POAL|nr:hypothetical protein EJB05_27364 [Eragrostis curvula]
MEDVDRERPAAAATAENGAEDYVVVKAGGDQEDLAAAAGRWRRPRPRMDLRMPLRRPRRKPRSQSRPRPRPRRPPSGARKAKPQQNGKVPAAAAAAASSAKAKKPGVLSQSASFPARGPSSARKAVTAAVATTPKQAKPEGKGAVPNGSGPAGIDPGLVSRLGIGGVASVLLNCGWNWAGCRPGGGEEGEFCSDACRAPVDGKAASLTDLVT